MRRRSGLVGTLAAVATLAFSAEGALAAAPAPTFSKDIAPILYEKCATCHRAGEVAPMALLSYEDARPWAKAIKAKVVAREMPPWGADPERSLKMRNDHSLSRGQIETITAYAMSPHMHLRGKSLKWVVTYPDGRDVTILDVPKFDFNWQINYELAEPLKIPAGSKISGVGVYDNSLANRWNPAPHLEVFWSEQSWDEMYQPFTEYSVDSQDLTKGDTLRRPTGQQP